MGKINDFIESGTVLSNQSLINYQIVACFIKQTHCVVSGLNQFGHSLRAEIKRMQLSVLVWYVCRFPHFYYVSLSSIYNAWNVRIINLKRQITNHQCEC